MVRRIKVGKLHANNDEEKNEYVLENQYNKDHVSQRQNIIRRQYYYV